jgi:broad specificity phosphatase PhoE
VAVDAALAEALGLEPDPLPEAMPEPEEIAPAGAITLSPRPRARPTAAPTTAAAGAPPAAAAALPIANEMDPALIPVGTRLVQFGAFDTADEARAEWVRLQASFGDLMAEKSLVVQPAESGGRTFVRLRAHGFEDEADARRFCAAFVAQEATCIPVPQR